MLLIKTIQVFFFRGFGALAGFIVTYLVTTNISIEQAGLFFLGVSIYQMAGAICQMGSGTSLVKLIGVNDQCNKRKINKDVSFTLKLISCTSFIYFVLLIFLDSQFESFFKSDINVLLVGSGGFIVALQLSVVSMFQGKGQPLISSLLANILPQMIFILTFYFISYSQITLFSSDSLIFIHLASLALVSVIGIITWYSFPGFKFNIKAKLSSELKYSLYSLSIIAVIHPITKWAGQLSSGFFLGAEQVALFASAQRMALLISFILIAVNVVFSPKIAKAFSNNRLNDVDSLALMSSRVMIVISMPLLIFIMIYPEFILGLLGPEYIEAKNILRILVIGQFFNVCSGSVGVILNMTNNERDMRKLVLIVSPIAIFLSVILTQIWGVIGAACATAIAMILQNTLEIYKVKKRLGFNSLNVFRKINNL